jgi:hypothetical protein
MVGGGMMVVVDGPVGWLHIAVSAAQPASPVTRQDVREEQGSRRANTAPRLSERRNIVNVRR